jgi:elongation factor 1-alpha
VERLHREKDSGNVEYKLMLTSDDPRTLQHLATQIRYRLNEGGGEAFFELGVSDEGEPLGLNEETLTHSLDILRRSSAIVGAQCQVLRTVEGRKGVIAEVLVRACREGELPVYLTIPMLGNVDSGKSSLIGVLCTGQLDDGNGLAMSKVARYLHEIEMRRTSSISSHLLGFTGDGETVNYRLLNPLDEAEVFMKSAKILSFIDLGGHERYLRTTLKGIMGRTPDYVIVVIGANAGIIGTTKEHLGVAVALRLPIIIVITKVDMVAEEQTAHVVEEVQRLLKLPGIARIPIVIATLDDAVVAARNMATGRIVPIFLVSNKTGFGLPLLRSFLNLLPPRLRWSEKFERPFLMWIDDKFNVKGVGTVVNGIIHQGSVGLDDLLQIGPFDDGSAKIVRVKSIHVNRVSVAKAFAGQDVCLALANVDYEEVQKGFVLLDKSQRMTPVRVFEARITVLHHPTTIWRGYNAVAHIQTIRQTVEFLEMSEEPLRTGVTADVKFRFKFRPEYIVPGDWFVFREGRTRGIGIISNVYA